MMTRVVLACAMILLLSDNGADAGDDRTGSPCFMDLSDDPFVDRLALKAARADVDIAAVLALRMTGARASVRRAVA